MSKLKLSCVLRALGLVLFLAAALVLTIVPRIHYVVSVDGQPVGYVENEQEVEQLFEKMQQLCSQQVTEKVTGDEVSIASAEVESQEVAAPALDVKLINNITVSKKYTEPKVGKLNEQILRDLLQYRVAAAVIRIDDEPLLALPDKETAQEVVDLIIAGYTTERGGRSIKKFKTLETIEITQELVDPQMLVDRKTAINKLSTGYEVVRTHVVSRGESLWSIAVQNGISVSDLREANPELKNTNIIQPGQKLKLQVPEPYIHVETVEVVTQTKYVPYDVKMVYRDDMYVWETKVITPGKQGRTEVTYEVIRVNGVEQSRKKLEENVLSKPQTKVVAKGTKAPPKIGTGQFIWPITAEGGGIITDYFGWTGRRYHHGIDIAVNRGTPIYAADAGTVIRRSYDRTYGYFIEIAHGGGYTTLYAHCSKLLVGVGQVVEKGQKIALVGNTGNSTGPHLHFEIRKEGRAVNPLNYFGK